MTEQGQEDKEVGHSGNMGGVPNAAGSRNYLKTEGQERLVNLAIRQSLGSKPTLNCVFFSVESKCCDSKGKPSV